MKRVIGILLLVLLFSTVPVYADELPLDVSAVEQELSKEARAISGELATDGSYDVEGAIARLLRRMKEEVIENLRAELKSVTGIIAVAMLCAVAEVLIGGGRGAELVSLCACAAVTLMTAGGLDSMTAQLNDAILSMDTYARSAIPAVYSALAVSGAVVSAGASYAAVCLGLNVMMDVLHKLTLPLIYTFLALCITRSIYPNPILNAAVNTVKWAAGTLMTTLTMGISAYISLTGALTGPADAAAVKGTKTVIATTLPVVGGILSDAASTVLASAGVIKNAAGVFALLGVCALCVAPFAAIGVKLLLFRFCAAVASAMEGPRLAGLLGDFSMALAMMLGLLGSMAIMLFVVFMAALRTVSG